MIVAETRCNSSVILSCLSLQWGRDLIVAETDHAADGTKKWFVASMGPRLDSRGNPRLALTARAAKSRFNGAAT